jgi:hypothetical protein
MEEAKKTTYTEARKRAYERNKEKIAAKEHDKKRWLKYYEENKEKIAERRKAKRAAQPKRPVDDKKIERYNELMGELQELKKEVALKKLRETLAKKATLTLVDPPASPGILPAPGPEDTPGDASRCVQ